MTLARVGTTTVENLLRVARSEAAASTAFAALHTGAGAPRIVSVPDVGSSEGLSTDDLAELVRRASADPEFQAARVFVRSVPLGKGLTLAVAPLRGTGDGDMIGLVAGADRQFEPAQLGVLERLAERLLRHLQVVRQLNGSGEHDGEEGQPRDHGPLRPEGAERRRGAERTARGVDDDDTSADDTADDEAAWERHSEPPRFPRVPLSSGPGARRFTQGAERDTGRFLDDPDVAPTASASVLWWAEPDPLTALPSLAQFFSRAGRLLALEGRPSGRGGAFALVALEVPDERTAPTAARVLTGELRFTDPVARVDRRVLAAALLLFPSGSGEAVEKRLAGAVRAAVERPGGVQTAHVVAEPGDHRDVDELLREVISRLQRR